MALASSGRDIVIFVGAGFSRDAMLPVMAEFGEWSALELQALKQRHMPAGSHGHRNAAPMLIEAGEVFTAFQCYCEGAAILKKEQINNLETVFCIAEAMREANVPGVTLRLNGLDRCLPLGMVVEQIQLWLWKIYNTCLFLDTTRDAPDRKPYDNFFAQIEGFRDRLTVLSTNYDLIFEWFALEHRVPCTYPITSSDHFWVGTGGRSYLADPADRLAPILCKLHGSINYFQRHGEPERVIVVDDAGSKTPLGKSAPEWPDRSPCIFAVDAVWQLRKDYGEDLVPAIIPPTYAKLTGHLWLRDIWHQAFEALRTARVILFIGYSMPESDGFMRALLYAAMAWPRTTPPPKVYVVDPSHKVRRRYCRLFRNLLQKEVALRLRNLDESELKRILS